MATEIITREDLQHFRQQLIQDLRDLLQQSTPSKQDIRWLKSGEVRKLLHISYGTLQNLRTQGKLRFSRIGGIHYYRSDDIEKLFGEANS
ncbi:helix-turn-helix domain-containing protein [Paraflavisolibacter sp. H34]|uniref:helix-turn-helix domain-containing protein n=1 Tax=Huijunlia imazamoxiresistens TaxID=3127457 RepID=UPI003017BE01